MKDRLARVQKGPFEATFGDSKSGRGPRQPEKSSAPEESLLASAIERVADGLVALDRDWCYTYLNSRAARMLQRNDPQELIGKHIWTEFPDGVGQPFYKAYLHAMETQEPTIFEDYYQPWDQWFENRVYPSPNGLTIYFTEISDRKHAQEALARSERQYRDLFENATDAIYVVDLKSQLIIDANGKAVEMLGYSIDEFRRLTMADLQPAAGSHGTDGDEWGSVSMQHQAKDGRLFAVETNTSIIEFGGDKAHLFNVRDVTERWQAVSKLAASAEYNRTLFEELPMGLALTRMTGELVDVNPAYAQLIGRTVEETLQLTYFDITPEKHEEDERRQLALLEQTGRYGPYEKEYIHRDGHLVPVRLSGLILEKDGEPFIWSSVEDITERKQTEAAINEHLLWNKQLLQTMMDGFLLADTKGAFVDVNSAYCELVGYSREELLEKNIQDVEMLLSPADIEQRIAHMVAQGGAKFETRHQHRNGDPVDLEVSITIIRRGDVPLVAGFVRDITESNRANKSLARAHRALLVLSGCNEVMVRALSEDELLERVCHIVAEVGEYQLAWIGYAEHDEDRSIRRVAEKGKAVGYLDEITVSWADNANGRGPTGTAVRTGELAATKNTVHDPGYTEWREAAQKHGFMSSIALPLRAGDEIYGALSIYSDESEAFDAEERRLLKELAENLSFGVTTLRAQSERRQLRRQLRQAQKMEAIGQLTGGIAHDFNNILASVMGYTELALSIGAGNMDPDLVEYLNEISQAGARARDLVKQMLAFSRSAGTSAQQIALGPSVDEAIKLLRPTLPSGVRIQVAADRATADIMMDPVHLHQIVMNLCINARDAVAGEGLVNVAVRDVVAVDTECSSCYKEIAGDFVELLVEDSGEGIAQKHFARIFDPFFSTKETGQGTGMGLSIVHGLVHEYGGHLVLNSSPGKGSSFRLLFPAVTGEPLLVGDDSESHSKLMPGGKGERLLVVDDDESVARFLDELLSWSGYQVTTMTSSTDALAIFKQNPQDYDLVISDQTMPGISGADLAREILELQPDIPTILCTGFSDKIDEAGAKALGVRRFLKKPVLPRVLLEVIKAALNEKVRDL